MSNLPVLQLMDAGTQLNTLPQNMLDVFGKMYNDAFSGVSGGNMRIIKVRKTDFFLNDGGEGESLPFNGLYAVLLGAANTNHAVWYKKKFAPGQAPEKPDLVWKFPDYETFPDALPEQFRQKVEVQGQMRWDFSIRRRTVWAVVRNDPQTRQMYIDFDKPYVFDIPSSSMYGKSSPETNEYKWSGLSQVCDKYSVGGVRVYPGMFVVQIVPDSKGTQGTVLFKPMLSGNGTLQLLSNDLIAKVFEMNQSKTVQDLCDVREKLTMDDGEASFPTQQFATPAPQPAPVQAASAPQQGPVQAAPAPQQGPVSIVQNVGTSAVPQPQPMPTTVTASAPVMPSESADAMSLLAEANAMIGNAAPAAPAPQPAPQPVPQAAPVSSAAADNIAAMMAALNK